MRHSYVFIALVFLFSSYSGGTLWAQESLKGHDNSSIFTIHNDPIDTDIASQINRWLTNGLDDIKGFFGTDFNQPFEVYLFSDRDSLDKQWQLDWNMPTFTSQCWMVASGIAHRLDILSPRVWPEQACEHNVEDSAATRKIIIHEMIHVFHGQHNPSPTFENIDNIDWFVEGIAVYASKQLDQVRYTDARKSIVEGEGPSQLANIWKGQNRYGLAGSIVQYIDHHHGRNTIIHLLGLTTADQMLEFLSITEDQLITNWKNYVKEHEDVPSEK